MRLGIVVDWLGGLGIVLLGLALRMAYVTHASLYIDEFTTIWAAQRVWATGLPQFPSGAVYTQGVIYTYLEAAALALGPFTTLLARLPSLVLGALTLALTLYAARRLSSKGDISPVGLAALWLAVDHQAILWSGRARTYVLLQFLVLIAFLAWVHGAVTDDRPGHRWLAIGLLLAALADQPLILLLLPPLALLALVARGWSWLRQPIVWVQAGAMGLGLIARWFLYGLMVPAGTTATAQPRAFVDLGQPFAGLESLAPFFADPNRVLPTLLLVGGSVWLLFRLRTQALAWGKPVLSCAFVLVFVVLEMFLIVGTSWRDPRYLYPLLPLLFLGAEGVAVPLLREAIKRIPQFSTRWLQVGVAVAFVALVLWLAYPAARAVTTRNEWGYDRALAFVGESWAEGDALATISPAAAFVTLGHCDYLAVEQGGQVLVVERQSQDGRRREDGWTGLPLLDSPGRLTEALDTHARLWFVVDEMRLDRHFSSEYLRLLWDRFDLVAFERGTFVFRSHPSEPAPAVERPVGEVLGGELRLVSYALSTDRLRAGETMDVTLYWAPEILQGTEHTAFVHLVNRDGEGVVGHDAPLLGGLYPVARWHRSPGSQPFPDRHALTLPTDLPAGRYRLEAGLYRSGTLEPVGQRVTIDFLRVGSYAEGLPSHGPLARFGDAVTLYKGRWSGDFELGGAAQLNLVWLVGPAGLDADYTLFIHLLDPEGKIAQQWDAPPLDGWYPTSYWMPGEIIHDSHDLSFSPMLTSGGYRLIAGLYRDDGARLLLDDGSDFVELGIIKVTP
ncbi:MAG: hypothetical protein PVH17_04355 [Anaerolineae bacterium]|jgi:hypothetical protein